MVTEAETPPVDLASDPIGVDDLPADALIDADVPASETADGLDDPIEGSESEDGDESGDDLRSEDTGEEATAAFTPPENWQETEGGKAFLKEWGENRDQRTLADALDVFNGKRDEKSVNSVARRTAREITAAIDAQVLARAQVDDEGIATAFNRFMTLEHIWNTNPDNEAFGERVNGDPALRALWNEWAGWAQQNGVSPNTPVSEVVAAVKENHRQTNLRQLRESYRDFNPEAVYNDYQEADDWSDLTAEQQAALSPDNFTGNAMQRIRQMERLYGGYLVALANTRKRHELQAKVDKVNHTANAAKRSEATTPPRLSGNAPRTDDYFTLRDRVMTLRQQGKSTPAIEARLDAAFERAKSAGRA